MGGGYEEGGGWLDMNVWFLMWVIHSLDLDLDLESTTWPGKIHNM